MTTTTVPIVGTCKDCGREMVSQPMWRRCPEVHDGRVRVGGQGMCSGCHIRAWRAGTLPDPAPRQARQPGHVLGACKDCGHPMITQKRWVELPDQRPEGYVPHGAKGRCNTCYCKNRRAAAAPRKPAPKPATSQKKAGGAGKTGLPVVDRTGEMPARLRRAAARTVASQAVDAAELGELLAMLGLTAGDGLEVSRG